MQTDLSFRTQSYTEVIPHNYSFYQVLHPKVNQLARSHSTRRLQKVSYKPFFPSHPKPIIHYTPQWLLNFSCVIIWVLNLIIRTSSLAQSLASYVPGFSFWQENVFQKFPFDNDLKCKDTAQTSNFTSNLFWNSPSSPTYTNTYITVKFTGWLNSNLNHLLVLGPLAANLTSQCLNILVYEMGLNWHLPHSTLMSIKLDNTCNI